MSGKLVYIDSVEQALNKAYGEGNPLRIGRILNNVSAVDAVEVVRCVECWHRFTGHFGMMCIGRPNDFFCANGERREEE